jgi:hypothetical protein
LNFYNFVLNAESDEEIQKEYNRVMGVIEWVILQKF